MIEIIFTDGSSIEVLEKNLSERIDLNKKWNCLYQEALNNGAAYLSQNFGEVKIRISLSLDRLNDVCFINSYEEVLKIEKGKIKLQ